MNKIETLNKIINRFSFEDNETSVDLRAIYDGTATASDETVADFRNLVNEDELTAEEIEVVASSTDEEIRSALTEYFKNFVDVQIDDEKYNIREAVSEWFDGHCHSDDFDSEYERQKYFRDLMDGNGDTDYIYDCIIDDIEYEYMTDAEVDDVIDDAIVDEASYWAD
jgi:hypothetical protein